MRLFACAIDESVSDRKYASRTAHRLLEYAVGVCWGLPCPAIALAEGGKPYFPGAENMHFSISHTKTHVLVGVSEHELGVDIETHRDVSPRLPERIFSAEMRGSFSFWDAWTARESVFKLTGRGSLLNMELRMVDGRVLTPFEGVRCRFYRSVPGCTAAVACVEGDFPDEIELVELSEFLP